MRVLAIDASLRNTGVAIVDANNGKPQSVYFGTIHNKSAMRPSSCLVAIRDTLAELIRECVWAKKPGHGIDSPEFLRPQRAMYQIGG